jgi:predicted negative regulator of RcsB-dependent stress response
MASKSDNKALLALIAVILLGILGLLIYTNFIEKTPEEKIADSVSETLDNIGNAVSKKTND